MFLNDNAIQILKSKKYKESTITTFDYNVKRIFKDAGFGDTYLGVKLQDYEPIINTIMRYPIKQQKQYIYIIMILFENSKFKRTEILKKYIEFFENVSQDRNNLLTMQEPNISINTSSTIDNLLNIYDDYKNKITNNPENRDLLIKHLIIALYIFLPPLRPQNFINTIFKYYENESQFINMNTIDLDTGIFTIKSGKTMKNGTTMKLQLDDELLNIIINVFNNTQSPFLIPTLTENNQMTQKQFTQLFKKITNGLTPTLLRNIYVSNYIDEHGIRNTKERQEIAHIMGHSVNTQNNIYGKYSLLLHNNSKK